MASFSASDAAFAGFRVVRERPMTAVWLAVIQMISGFGFSALMILVAGPAMTRLTNASAATASDPAQSLQLLGQIAPLYLLLIPLSVMFYALIYAAMNRAVLRPSQSRFGYFRLGADELRQAGLLVAIWLLFLVAYLASVILAVVVGTIVSLALSMFGANPVVQAIQFTIVFAMVLAPLIYLGVRLSLASPQTFATGRFDLFGSWALTKGHASRIFAAYLLAFVVLLVMMALAFAILTAAMSAVSGQGLEQVWVLFSKADMTTMAGYFTPVRVVYLSLFAVFSGLFLPVWLTPPAAIYQSLTAPFGAGADGRPATVESIFS